MSIVSKICTKCKEDKNIDEYYDSLKTKDSKRSICKTCFAINSAINAAKNRIKLQNRQNEKRAANPSLAREKERNAYIKNGDQVRERKRIYHNNNLDANHKKWRKWYLKKNYGITEDEYDQKLLSQGGVCVGCGGVNKAGKRLAVDHDHATGKARGLLCGKCNQGLERVENVSGWAQWAVDYLALHRGDVNGT